MRNPQVYKPANISTNCNTFKTVSETQISGESTNTDISPFRYMLLRGYVNKLIINCSIQYFPRHRIIIDPSFNFLKCTFHRVGEGFKSGAQL